MVIIYYHLMRKKTLLGEAQSKKTIFLSQVLRNNCCVVDLILGERFQFHFIVVEDLAFF